MTYRTEASSLVALRELRDMERRRMEEAEPESAKQEKQRHDQEQARLRAEEERLARERAERETARAAAEAVHLRHELTDARSELARLRAQLDSGSFAQARLTPVAAPPASAARTRPFAWLGVTAGASMLVGALALFAAAQPRDSRAMFPDFPARPTSLCPSAPSAPSVPPSPPAPPVTSAISAPRPTPRPRPSPAVRPRGESKPASAPTCDGTDPLCGLPLGAIDDVGKPRRRGQGK